MINSAEEFVQLRESNNPDDYERAAYEETNNEVWYEVINNYPDMKAWVAYNKSVPLEILNVLSCDSDKNVRRAVAMKRKLNLELFEQLAMDADESVRLRIACNKKAPQKVLEYLVKDPEKIVSDIAMQRLNDMKKNAVKPGS